MKENDFEILSKKNNSIDFIYNKEKYYLRKTDYDENKYSYYITKNKDIDRICLLFDYHKDDNYYFIHLANKKKFDLDFFNTLIKNKLINEKINYNDIYDFNFQSEISQKKNIYKETPKTIVLVEKNGDYETSISAFNFNNETYFVTKDGDDSCFLYSIEKYNKDLNLKENVIEFNRTVHKEYEVFVKNEKKY